MNFRLKNILFKNISLFSAELILATSELIYALRSRLKIEINTLVILNCEINSIILALLSEFNLSKIDEFS